MNTTSVVDFFKALCTCWTKNNKKQNMMRCCLYFLLSNNYKFETICAIFQFHFSYYVILRVFFKVFFFNLKLLQFLIFTILVCFLSCLKNKVKVKHKKIVVNFRYNKDNLIFEIVIMLLQSVLKGCNSLMLLKINNPLFLYVFLWYK